MLEAYLDIETSFEYQITVIGIFREDRGFQQLVGRRVNQTNLLRLLQGSGEIITYNGSRFDLPVIRRNLGVNLGERFESNDLMYSCWHKNLYGGLKSVERALGIPRQSADIDGFEAMRLWRRYEEARDRKALERLLAYNEEDVMNLVKLKEILRSHPSSAKKSHTHFSFRGKQV